MDIILEEFGQTVLAILGGSAIVGIVWMVLETASAF